MLEDNFEGMKGYIKYMQTWVNEDGIMHSQRRNNSGEILKWFNLGEWVAPGETVPDEFVHTFYFWYCTDITAKVAGILSMKDEAKHYEKLAEQTKRAFHKRFYDEKTGSYGNGGGNILALKMGVPQEQYPKVISALKANIKANKGHLDTGIFGTRFFFEVLAENGMHDLAYAAMNKTTEPSFGHWITLGSTTTREKWDEGGSHNHPMFGGGLVWFYRNLAGMKADMDQPGYKHIIYKPQILDDLSYVRYFNRTPYGKAGIHWSKTEEEFSMKITVPVSCTATVYIPADDRKIMESENSIENVENVDFVKKDGIYSVYTVQSGEYNFLVK